MCQNADYLREAVNLTDVDKLQSFHLVIKARINQQQNLTQTNAHMDHFNDHFPGKPTDFLVSFVRKQKILRLR